jgi:beta-glucosidase
MRITRFLFAGVLLTMGWSASSALCQSNACPIPDANEKRPWLNEKYSSVCRAEFVLKTLKTLDEKLTFISEGNSSVLQGSPRMMKELGLSACQWSDGPAGVGFGTATAFPTPLSVAANFDTTIATKFGELLGQEFFDSGYNCMGGPAMDMARTWHFGRLTESFGEDPYLDAATIGAEVKGIQSKHVIVTMKHYAVYTQEQGRVGYQPIGMQPAVNEIVSERAIREIYLPGFRSAVVNGGAGGAMCSFPGINGVHACENPYLINILKREWGFDGSVIPDTPNAQRDIIPSFLAGMDEGVISDKGGWDAAPYVGMKTLREGIESGEVPMSRIDDIIMRRLVPGFRIGTFDNPAKNVRDASTIGTFDNSAIKNAPDASTSDHRAAAVDIITGGAVLLKNQGNVLPLVSNVKTIAIIGTQATERAWVIEQGSPYVKPTHLEPVFPVIQKRAGDAVRVNFALGTLGLAELPSVPKTMLKTPSGQPGVLAEFFGNSKLDFSGKPVSSHIQDNFKIEKSPTVEGLPKDLQYSVRFLGIFTPDKTGVQKFTLPLSGTGRLFIGDKLMGKIDRADFTDTIFANVLMTAGKPVEIRVEYTPREVLMPEAMPLFGIKLGLYCNLGWAEPDDLIEQAVETARKADAAVVFVGHQIGEGMDRLSLALPNDQDALIEAVARANPRTIVVLNIGGPVAMPWLDKVAGVLQMWLPGDAYGPAAARLLFGDADPGGRLPVTFPKDEAQGPAQTESEYPGTLSEKGALADIHFNEGIFIGYRYWDQYKQEPLFPFGYGLSYTSFEMKGLGVHANEDGSALVDVSLKNTGVRAGSEVVQVYVGFPASAGEPPKQLKGFQKVYLKPSEETRVQIRLDSEAFKYWNEQTHAWTSASGDFGIMVGRSSRDIVYTANLTMKPNL